MENAKHTPGPWVYGPETGPDCTRIDSENGTVIAAVITRRIESWEKSRPIYSWNHEAAANARLIAAAPKLLEALEYILTRTDIHVIYDTARAAIAKATGRDA